MHAPSLAHGQSLPDADARPLAGFAVVAFLGVIAGVQMSDRGLQSILSPAIRQTFSVGDAVMGSLHGIAGILVASALALPLARLADRYARTAILIGLIVAWTALTLLGALAPNFPLFFLGRAASGVTEFAMIPIVYSLIPDLVGERWRVEANLTFAALMAIGASAGFYLAGAILAFATAFDLSAFHGPTEPWRKAMLLLSLAGIPLAAIGLAIREPPRGRAEADAETSGSLVDFIRTRRREILLFVGTAGGLAVAVQALIPMAAMAIVRRFSADLDTVGHGLGIATLITSLASLPLAGVLDRLLRARLGQGSRPAMMMAMSLLAIPCAWGLTAVGDTQGAIWAVAAFLVVTSLGNALIPTMLQDLAPATLRARAFAAYSFVIAAFCALGPLLSGLISDHVTSGNLVLAIGIASAPALAIAAVCAGLNLAGSLQASRVLRSDASI